MSFALGAGDPAPVELIHGDGRAPLVLTCEHGGNAIPVSLRDLAPGPEDMARHIAWDIGAAEVARGVAARLDAALAIQPYSRLVIDCNRPRHAADLTPIVCDGSTISFNEALDEAEQEARWQAIHQPFHRAVADILEGRGPVALIAVHSFTPRLRNAAGREMAAGLLVRRNRSLAEAVRKVMAARASELAVVFNAPYRIEDESDYTIPVHGEARGLPHLLLEIRNDLIATPSGVERWIELLSGSLLIALPQVLERT
jgi:predicted N-formylglutamate amidohydrolase